MPKHDVFLCHASEDKATFVRPLAEALTECGLRVWYDEYELRPGDSLREKIDHGISNSRQGIVVVSPRFFERRWTSWELNGLLQWHLASEHRVILPIWLNVSAEQVRRFSPSLADVVAVRADIGVGAVAKVVIEVLGNPALPLDTDEQHRISRALRALPVVLGLDPAHVSRMALFVVEGDYLVAKVVIGQPKSNVLRIGVEGSLSGRAFQDQSIIKVADLQQNLVNITEFEAARSMLVVPLIGSSGDVYGVLSFISNAPGGFSTVPLETIDAVRALLGPMIELVSLSRNS